MAGTALFGILAAGLTSPRWALLLVTGGALAILVRKARGPASRSRVICPRCARVHVDPRLEEAGPRMLEDLGVEVSDRSVSLIIPCCTLLPAAASDVFTTVHDHQADVGIHLVGRDVPSPLRRTLARAVHPIKRRGPRGGPQIQVTVTVDEQGAVEIEAVEVGATNAARYRGSAARIAPARGAATLPN